MKSAVEIHQEYLEREEPELIHEGKVSRPALKVQDKCYKFDVHHTKMIYGYNENLPNWSNEQEEELLTFIKDNQLDTKICLYMKQVMVRGLTLVEAYESYLDSKRKPHPVYNPVFGNKTSNEVYKKLQRMNDSRIKLKGLKKQSTFTFLDDPNPSEWVDFAVNYD